MLYVLNIIYNKESAESKLSLYISTFNQLSPILSNPNKPDCNRMCLCGWWLWLCLLAQMSFGWRIKCRGQLKA